MENFLNNDKPINPISEVFNNLSTNQKMSIINLLQLIAVSDSDQGNREKELKFLNSYIDILYVPFDKCMVYFQTDGPKKIITDLTTLSKNQKEFLAYIAWEMIICDGNANETEVTLTVNIFSQIGISEENFVKTIEKNRAILNQFNK